MGKMITDMQLVPIDKLVPYVNNARTHSPEQITKLRSSLREFGFVNPVIIDRDFNVLAGHGRLAAAKAENISEVPCVFADYLTEAQKKAYILADNRYAMDAGWDEEMLRVEIEALQGMEFDLGLTGFDEKEIADLFDMDDGDGKEDGFDVDAELEKHVNLQLKWEQFTVDPNSGFGGGWGTHYIDVLLDGAAITDFEVTSGNESVCTVSKDAQGRIVLNAFGAGDSIITVTARGGHQSFRWHSE